MLWHRLASCPATHQHRPDMGDMGSQKEHKPDMGDLGRHEEQQQIEVMEIQGDHEQEYELAWFEDI